MYYVLFFEGAKDYPSEFFGKGSGAVLLGNIHCPGGGHPKPTSCYIYSGDCPATGKDVGVRCDGE